MRPINQNSPYFGCNICNKIVKTLTDAKLEHKDAVNFVAENVTRLGDQFNGKPLSIGHQPLHEGIARSIELKVEKLIAGYKGIIPSSKQFASDFSELGK